MSKQKETDLFWFKFEPKKWLTGDIIYELPGTQGIFLLCCCHIWLKKFTLTQADLKQRLNFASIEIDLLLTKGFLVEKNEGGQIEVKFLKTQHIELTELAEKRAIAGKKGGEASVKQRLSKTQPKVKHSKKESEPKKDKLITIPTIEEFLVKIKEISIKKEVDYNSIKSSAETKYDTWVENSWKDGYDKPIKNWKSKATAIFQYLKRDEIIKTSLQTQNSDPYKNKEVI